jgi:hypothetical protein
MKTMVILIALLSACNATCEVKVGGPDAALATAIGKALARACPPEADPASEAQRDGCADRLTELEPLRHAMREPFIWGGQPQSGGYALERGTNKFNPRVWRRMYLSTFMFGRASTVERVGADTILHVPVTFRGAMPAGAYPYPFWHSAKKWDAYNFATTIHFVIRDGAILGALRGTTQDRTRPVTAHTWDGKWGSPHVSLYAYLFSPRNPHVPALDAAYRALEAGLRANNCHACHAPDNRGAAAQLEFFVYPNQALTGRHDIVAQLEDDTMPPENKLGLPAGLPDAERARLIELARTFDAAGDQALTWEGEP